jgi:hypothetical protein
MDEFVRVYFAKRRMGYKPWVASMLAASSEACYLAFKR